MGSPYDNLYRAIGRVVYEWAWLEADVAALVFDLCAIHSDSFYHDKGVGVVSSTLHADLDLKANISVAKSLAHQIPVDGFFLRVESVLNPINNDMRNERNRFVHDRWWLDGEQAIRYKKGTIIRREPATGNPTLGFGAQKEFEKIEDVDAFANRINRQRRAVMALSEEAQAIYREKYPA